MLPHTYVCNLQNYYRHPKFTQYRYISNMATAVVVQSFKFWLSTRCKHLKKNTKTLQNVILDTHLS